MDKPLISVITVCYNAAATIEETIKSVIGQTIFSELEYIIVDGQSKDKTLEIINRYRSSIATLISEKDKGLYDAMNKGLKQATGEYVIFMNADDMFYSPDILEKSFSKCPNADVIYGEAMFVDNKGKELGLRSEKTPHKVPKHLNWKSLKYGMVVSHQAFIIRRTLTKSYDLQYPVCADIDWMIGSLKNCRTICNTGLTMSRFRIGGFSKQNQRSGWKERYQILNKYYGTIPNFLAHLYIGLRYLLTRKSQPGA